MIAIRNSRHSYLRSLALQWIRRHKPGVYRVLFNQARQKYPAKVSSSNNSNSER